MSSQAPNTSPASPPDPHGGDTDPNETRRRERRAQQIAASPSHFASNPSFTPLTDPSHGGDTDPNAVRLREARMQQASGLSSPAATSMTPSTNNPDVIAMSTPPQGGYTDPNDVRLRQTRMQQTPGSSPSVTGRSEPNAAGASYGGVSTPQTQIQPARYGTSASPHPAPYFPPYGHNGYQSPRSPPNAQAEQYFPTSNGHQPAQPNPAQQFPQTGLPTQGNGSYPMTSILSHPSPQSPQSQSAPPGQYFPTFNGYPPTYPSQGQSQQSPQSFQSEAPSQGSGNYPMGNPAGSPAGTPYARAHSYGSSQAWTMNKEAGPYARAIEADAEARAPAEQGNTNMFHPKRKLRWKWPNTYQEPSASRSGDHRRHRDTIQRAEEYPKEDYYLSPYDGHLAKLFVQSTQAIYDTNSDSTWRRTHIRNQSPLLLQVANWVLHTLPTDDREATGADIAMVGLKWIPSCVAILLLMIYPVQASGQVRNGGKYDSLPYRFWGYPYYARNAQERKVELSNRSSSPLQPSIALPGQQVQETTSSLNPVLERPVEPKYLCFLDDSQAIRKVSEWKKANDREATYILVSYTSEQFKTDVEQLFLHDVGEKAARAAGVQAYWVGCSCLGHTKQEQEDNVWTISDVVRGARRLIIAVSGPKNEGDPIPNTMAALRQWGTRVWTLPEVLLISGNSDIRVYARHANIDRPMTYSKQNFSTLWEDTPISRELIDHYEGNLILSSLELVTIALRCLHNRHKGSYLPGDMAYALMGLLRRRPTIVKTDKAFQAFARLSLANDNNFLLERLICILPRTTNQPWYDMDDQWGVSLWDIKPTTQVCGIADNDTVMIDGGYAAAIRWKAFAHVANATRDSWRRFFFRYAFRSTSYLFFLGIGLLSTGTAQRRTEDEEGYNHASSDIYIGIGAFFLVIALIFVLLSPYIIRVLYTGKIWGVQAWFFGFEGYMDIGTIEQHIFGADMGHLKWSTNGSPLSLHEPNEYGECIGQDPTSNPETAEKVRRSVNARMGDERIFTLVDTNTLTVTLFSAVRPPVAIVLCGEEGGMQRALLCSYDWSTQTLYRESVLRVETVILEQMARVGRLRLGLSRKAL